MTTHKELMESLSTKEVLELAIRDCENVAASWDYTAGDLRRKYLRFLDLKCPNAADDHLKDSVVAEEKASVARACAFRIRERLAVIEKGD